MIETFESPAEMARVLSSYISDPRKVQAEVYTSTHKRISLHTINAYRGAFLRRKAKPKPDFDRSVTQEDARHVDYMTSASDEMRDAIASALADRHQREQMVRDRNDAARKDIKLGKQRDWIMREHGLSATSYEQLASQVRAVA